MATAILDKLLQSQFGKHFIFWVFLALVGANVAQWFDRKRQDSALEKCNEWRIADNRMHEEEKSKLTKEHIADLQQFISRLEAVEKKRKR